MSDSTITIIGVGGIGHPAAVALAGGPWSVRLVDDDRVERSNLHRLAFAHESDVGRLKVEVTAHAMERAGHPSHRIECLNARMRPDVIESSLKDTRVVIEGADNYATKFLVADAAGIAGVSSVHGAAVGWIGTVLSVLPGSSACYRCIFEDLPSGDDANCATVGVMGPLTSLVGAIMAADAARFTRSDSSMAGSLFTVDSLAGRTRMTRFTRRSDCLLCGEGKIRSLDSKRYNRQCSV